MSDLEYLKKTIGSKIKEIRKHNKLSQVELARLSGLDRTYISHIEKGETNISITSLYMICVVLNTSVVDFFLYIKNDNMNFSRD